MNKFYEILYSIGVIFAFWTSIDAYPFQIEDENNPNASLSCILFETWGCNVECAIVHKLYKFESTGTCNKYSACLCNVKEKPTFDGTVPKTFNDEILKNGKSSKPLKKRSRPSNKWLRNYAASELGKIVGYEGNNQQIDFSSNLMKYLDENKSNSGIQKVFHQIRLIPNAALHDMLDTYLKEHDVEEIIFYDDDDNSTWQTLIGFIIDELVCGVGISYDNELDLFFNSDEFLVPKFKKINRRG